MGAFLDLTGQRFGRLTVRSRGEKDRHGNYRWVCDCDCGGTKEALSNNLRREMTTSCGCYQADRVREVCGTHGLQDTPEYASWNGMKQRCSNPATPCYHRYGRRGITVCDRWRHSFEAFLTDMGKRPTPEHTIDRVDNNSGYSPDNCRWATKSEQARNTRRNLLLTHDGETKTLAEWSLEKGLRRTTISERLKRGVPVAEALETPVGSRFK